jgi:hypothetical protein
VTFAFIDRPPNWSELEKFRLMLSTYQDGGGQLILKNGQSLPGWRDFERAVAAAFGGAPQENKFIFDVLFPDTRQPEIQSGISCKMRRTLDLDRSCYLALSWNPQGEYQLFQFGLNLPAGQEIVWDFPEVQKPNSQAAIGKRLRGRDQSGVIFEWYGESGGQLKYYPQAEGAGRRIRRDRQRRLSLLRPGHGPATGRNRPALCGRTDRDAPAARLAKALHGQTLYTNLEMLPALMLERGPDRAPAYKPPGAPNTPKTRARCRSKPSRCTMPRSRWPTRPISPPFSATRTRTATSSSATPASRDTRSASTSTNSSSAHQASLARPAPANPS